MKKPKVLFIASELTPLAKVGGLGDVAGALPPALTELDVDIKVIIPKYDIIDTKKYPLRLLARDLVVTFGSVREKINLYETTIPQRATPVILIDNLNYLGRDGVYFEKSALVSGFEEIQRFLFFSEAVLQTFKALNWWPEIIHCQDWHTGIIPALIRLKGEEDKGYQKIKTLFTIHNLANQGKWRAEAIFNFLGLKEKEREAFELQSNGDLNLMQLGILEADLINTVSPNYAQEILTPEYGEGLETTLARRKNDLSGIINGIDVNRFNPETDPDIKTNYSLKNLEKKIENKIALQEFSGLAPRTNEPLLGLVSRLTNQKGIDLIGEIIDELASLNLELVFLGTGDPKLENLLAEAQKKYPEKISAKIGFDAKLAEQIYAGADFFLMPSRFEPCGLGQMIAMRYGTVPIVRATGGLKDTVTNFDPKTRQGTGFVFKNYSSQELLQTIKSALRVFADKKNWTALVTNGLKEDFSWQNSAKKYLKLYQKIFS